MSYPFKMKSFDSSDDKVFDSIVSFLFSDKGKKKKKNKKNKDKNDISSKS